MTEVAKGTASVYGAEAEVTMLSQVPPLICDRNFTTEIVEYMQQSQIPGLIPVPGISASASEDFATIAEKVPSAFVYLSAGFQDERGEAPAHNPKVRFNEEVCPIGAAAYAYCAEKWLEDHR